MDNNLRFLRKERNLTIRDVEALTGIRNNTYSRYETNVLDLSTENIKKLADFYEVSTDYLLNYSNEYITVYYELADTYYHIDFDTWNYLKNHEIIYYVNNKRCINLNKLFNINEAYDLSELIEKIFTVNSKFSDFKRSIKAIIFLNMELLELLNRLIIHTLTANN